jgi:histidine triad (HIT) family protein
MGVCISQKMPDENQETQSKLFQEFEEQEQKKKERSKSDSLDTCAFCSIVKGEPGETPSRNVVFEDRISIAFLDRKPVFLGHCLLVPKEHYGTLYQLPQEVVGPLFQNAQLLGRAVESAMKADGSFVAINNAVSQSVPHLHIHVIPRKFRDGLRGFFWPRMEYESPEQMAQIADSIRASLNKRNSIN